VRTCTCPRQLFSHRGESPVGFFLDFEKFQREISPSLERWRSHNPWGTITLMNSGKFLRVVATCALLTSGCNRENPNLSVVCSADEDCGEDAICTERRGASRIKQCTAGCVTDERCIEVFGEDSACNVECYRPCDEDNVPCPAQTMCVFGACVPICSSDTDCDPGVACTASFCH